MRHNNRGRPREDELRRIREAEYWYVIQTRPIYRIIHDISLRERSTYLLSEGKLTLVSSGLSAADLNMLAECDKLLAYLRAKASQMVGPLENVSSVAAEPTCGDIANAYRTLADTRTSVKTPDHVIRLNIPFTGQRRDMSKSATTRQEHLDWCKKRALEYVDAGDMSGAFDSFASDVRKHPETAGIGQTVATLGMPLLVAGLLDTPQKMREHITGYN